MGDLNVEETVGTLMEKSNKKRECFQDLKIDK